MTTKILELIEKTDNGELQILDTFIELRENKNTLEYLLSKIKDFEKRYSNQIEAEAMDYPEGYKGYEIKLVSGRTTFNFKNLDEWVKAEETKKKLEAKYKSLYNVYQKTNERPMSEDGEVYDLPEVNYGASFFKVSHVKK